MLLFALRRLRSESLGTLAVLVAVGVLAVVTGTAMRSTFEASGLADCLAAPGADCSALREHFAGRFESLQVLILPLVLLPALLGAFVGAPLVARDVEAGTHRFLWTQGVTRQRWMASITTGAAVLAASAGLAYALIASSWLDVTNRVTGERFARLYDLQGLVPAASALFAVAVGIACGVALRRTVPAMAATIGIFVAVRLLVATQLRPRLASPVVADVAFDGRTSGAITEAGAWILSRRTLTRTGTELGTNGSLDLTRIQGRCPDLRPTSVGGLPSEGAVQRCLQDLGVHELLRYHPSHRFWTFQLIESGILLALGAVAIAGAFWLLRRRAS